MKKSKTNFKDLENLKDEEIDFSDIPRMKKSFFKKAILNIPEPKKSISLRIDQDVLDWFKSQGRGYQTRINTVLKLFKEAQV